MGGRAGGRSTGNAVKVTPTVGSPGSSAPPADRHPKHVAGEFARKLVHASVRVKGCSGSFLIFILQFIHAFLRARASGDAGVDFWLRARPWFRRVILPSRCLACHRRSLRCESYLDL